ncbi:MAG: cation:proton antiporter [Candidatus Cloacimonetes bacterium]|nr:cation:proton antiporter [Candidatus Cloacimonadota bacterium]
MNTILNSLYNISDLLIIGIVIIASFFSGRLVKYIKLPSLIGFMLIGVILGPSLLNILGEVKQEHLGFLTEIALSFIALSIGLELNFASIKKLGKGIVWIILLESFGTFIIVAGIVFLVTGNLPLALILGGIAPASAPEGTVAVIQEYKAKGPLTKTLYAVVGFDDGLGIVIFGFAAAIAKKLLMHEAGAINTSFAIMMLEPIKEIGLSILAGVILAFFFSLVSKKISNSGDVSLILIGTTFVAIGLSIQFHLSLIMINLIVGLVVVNTQSHELIEKIRDRLPSYMPLLFILFFALAGASLNFSALPALGLVGLVYILTRSGGLIFGARLGASLGHVDKKIKNWIGLGILSQGGVAIGLSLIVKHDFSGLGKIIETGKTSGDALGITVITLVTATSVVFSMIGPILAKIALKKAGEIESGKHSD